MLHKYCYMQYNVLFSRVKNCALKMISDALFEFKSKDKYERKMLNRLKRNFKRKIYINSFCWMPQVLFFFGAGRWTVKQWKNMKVASKCDVTEFRRYDDIGRESKACSIAAWTKRKRMKKLLNIYYWSDFL